MRCLFISRANIQKQVGFIKVKSMTKGKWS